MFPAGRRAAPRSGKDHRRSPMTRPATGPAHTTGDRTKPISRRTRRDRPYAADGEVFDHVSRGLFKSDGTGTRRSSAWRRPRMDRSVRGRPASSRAAMARCRRRRPSSSTRSRRGGGSDTPVDGRPLLEQVRFEFSALPAGTRIMSRMTFTPNARVTAALGPLLRRVIARNVRTNTERMRETIEGDWGAGRQ